MSKICSSCGRELPDYAMTCTYCGGAVNGATNQYGNDGFNNNFNTSSLSKNKKKLIIILGISVVVVAVVAVLLFTLVFSDGAEKAVLRYYDVMYNEEYEEIENLAPKDLIRCLEKTMKIDAEDVADSLPDIYDQYIEQYEKKYESDVISIDYEIVETDEIKGEKMKEEAMEELKDEYDLKESRVEAFKCCGVRFVVETEDGDDVIYRSTYAVKIDGEWYPCDSEGNLMIESLFWACREPD